MIYQTKYEVAQECKTKELRLQNQWILFYHHLYGKETALAKEIQKRSRINTSNLTQRFTGIELDFYSFMPDHLHTIFILENSKVSIGEIIRTYKALVTRATDRKPFWEWNYHEHVIRNEHALYEIRKYIQENPDKEKIDLNNIYRRINPTAT